jgi:hypothetical protein
VDDLTPTTNAMGPIRHRLPDFFETSRDAGRRRSAALHFLKRRTSRRSPPTGPLPETSDLVAGWFMIDVESRERAVELASYVSSEPGPAGAARNRVQIALPVHDAME